MEDRDARSRHLRIDHPQGSALQAGPRGSFVYTGRPTIFGNPIRLADPTDEGERERVIVQYAEYFQTRIASDAVFRRAVEALRGRDLGCWCAPRRCHGEVILAWLATHPPADGSCTA